ncbi:hypothetical protein PENTCL1PPCAC_20548, partial [Pristionchus entomophagus]
MLHPDPTRKSLRLFRFLLVVGDGEALECCLFHSSNNDLLAQLLRLECFHGVPMAFNAPLMLSTITSFHRLETRSIFAVMRPISGLHCLTSAES